MKGRALENYYSILNGDREAKYLAAKRRELNVDLFSEDRVLWRMHDEGSDPVIEQAERKTIHSEIDLKVELARRQLRSCHLCERGCGVDRSAGEKGHCRVLEARISSEFIHMGEEPDLVPSYTVFFSGCTFSCVFCQNWDISTRPEAGVEISPSALARKIERMAGGGGKRRFGRTRNVNWVGGDPTSNLPFILEVLDQCEGNIPQVWNSNMYLSMESMKLLKGIVDVYLTDFKYGNDECALRLSNAPDYMRIVQRNHLLARRDSEMIIRHLALPGHVDCCTTPVLEWIAENLKDIKVNVMGQYRPEHRAREYSEIARPLSMAEYNKAIEMAETLGLDLCD